MGGLGGGMGRNSLPAADDVGFVEAVLKLRARRLAASRHDEAKGAEGVSALGFVVAGERYAVPLDTLSEVLPLGGWTPVPGQPQYLLGVVNVRGDIRPILDLHVLLNLPAPAPEAGQAGHAVFLRAGGREVGLRVDMVERIDFIETAGLTLPNESANGLPQRFIAGITPETLVLLDVRQILALDVLQDRSAEYRRV